MSTRTGSILSLYACFRFYTYFHIVYVYLMIRQTFSGDIMNSFAGSTGQRCMAASVLLKVGNDFPPAFEELLVKKASALKAGQEAGEIGPVRIIINMGSRNKWSLSRVLQVLSKPAKPSRSCSQ